MEHFYIITNRHKDPELKVAEKIRNYLTGHGKSCIVQEKVRDAGGRVSYTDSTWIPEDVDCMIVIGGDGTMLQAARDTANRNIPMIGVNLGTLGFLAEVEQANLENALSSLVHDEYMLEERMMLIGVIERKGCEPEEEWALNDISVTRSGSLQITNLKLYVNGQFLNGLRADGVMVSTPTGSTGYNLSAGGPIVEPKAKLLLITPICPHTLNTRSIVLAPEDKVTIEIGPGRGESSQEVEVNFDGNHQVTLKTGDKIHISKSEKTTDIVKLSNVSFLEILHRKMSEQ